MKSVHKIHFPPLRSQFKNNLASISGIRGGPQKPWGHLVHTEQIQPQKKHEFLLQKRVEIAERRNFELLSTAEEGTLSSSTYSNLVRDTFQMRRKFITQEANSSKEILNVCPYLGKPSHVS